MFLNGVYATRDHAGKREDLFNRSRHDTEKAIEGQTVSTPLTDRMRTELNS